MPFIIRQRGASYNVTKPKGDTIVESLDDSFKKVQIDGIRQLYNATTGHLKLIWLILILIFGGIMIYEIYKTIGDYIDNPVKTSFTIKMVEEVRLPQIYMCPSFTVSQDFWRENSSRVELAYRLDKILNIWKNRKLPDSPVDYGDLGHLNGASLKSIWDDMGYEKASIFYQCSFREMFSVKVSCPSIYVPTLDTSKGTVCYTIDAQDYREVLQNNGLTVVSIIDDLSFVRNSIKFKDGGSLETPKFNGVSVSVHDKIDPTNFHNEILIPNGQYCKIYLWRQEVKFLNDDPNQNCESNLEFKILNALYSKQSCRLDCFLAKFLDICSCLPLLDEIYIKENISTKYESCTVYQLIKCYWTSPEKFHQSNNCSRKCRQACHFGQFDIRISCMPLNPYSMQDHPDVKRGLMNMSDLIRKITIWGISYSRHEFKQYSSSWSMSLDDVISNIGGQVNLWLGMTMFTMIQIPSIILFIVGTFVYNRCRRRN
uniref:Uncharacterized protein n=1 Tax=Romanomermis culicivorax TaxID=13658 RepID=A0A915IGZ1_ROMCU